MGIGDHRGGLVLRFRPKSHRPASDQGDQAGSGAETK